MRSILMLACTVFWVLVLAYAAQEAAVEAPPSVWDDHILALDRQALDTAYAQQIALLYGTWMKDYADAVETPRRVATGARNARNAYIRAMTRIEARRK